MFNILDELQIGLVVKEKQDRLAREAWITRLLRKVHTRQGESRKERGSLAEFLALAFRALGTNGQINWKL